MKLLIGASPSKNFHLKEFSEKLLEKGIESKVVIDSQIYDGFPSRKIKHWFQTKNKFNELINEFQPDAIFIDRQRHFGLATINAKIPLLVHVRGDFWSEIKWAKETTYKKFPKNIVIKKWEKMGNQIFKNAKYVLPICKFLENKVHEMYPEKMTYVLYQ